MESVNLFSPSPHQIRVINSYEACVSLGDKQLSLFSRLTFGQRVREFFRRKHHFIQIQVSQSDSRKVYARVADLIAFCGITQIEPRKQKDIDLSKIKAELVGKRILWPDTDLINKAREVIGEDLNEEDEKALRFLCKHVGGEKKLLQLFDEFQGTKQDLDKALGLNPLRDGNKAAEEFVANNKKMLLKTFLKVAHTLYKGDSLKLPSEKIYVRKEKGHHFSFTISKKGKIYLTLGKLFKGSSKKVSAAIELRNMAAYVRPTTYHLEEALEEQKLMQELYKSNSKYFVKPYKFTLKSTTKKGVNKLIMLQVRYDGDGATLIPKNFKSSLSEIKKIVSFLRDSARGLAKLHEMGYVHADYKPENCLLDNGVAKLADFGLTQAIGSVENGFTYAPPEFYKLKRTLHEGWDSYALGISVIRLVLGDIECQKLVPRRICIPEIQERLDQLIRSISFDVETGKKPLLLEKIKLLEVAKQLVLEDPNKRMTCKDAAARFEKILTSL